VRTAEELAAFYKAIPGRNKTICIMLFELLVDV
jgi:hypothetical protein